MRQNAPPRSGALTPKGFRLDIQGIRGIGLVLVLAAHAGVPGFDGGFVALDAFFVLSGFLITGLLLAELRRTGRISLRDFYARRARRLLPLAGLVLAVVAVGALVLFATPRLHDASGDVLSASLYVSNWHFMANQTDYFAFEDVGASPVLHYWSLSIEEQFYILWPLLLIAVTALAAHLRLRRVGARGLLLAVIGTVTAASLAYSISFSALDPDRAYFSTLTRIWEISAGGLLAVVLPVGLRMGRVPATLLSAGGVGGLLVMTALYEQSTPYPGWQALVPVAATLAIIVGGTAERPALGTRLLMTRPMQDLGKVSYAWYLWHWPALAFATELLGHTLTPVEAVAIILLAAVPTIISHHLVEERFRRSRTLAARPRRSLALGWSCMTATVALAFVVVVLRPGLAAAPAEAVTGARSAHRNVLQEKVRQISPTPATASDDKGRLWYDGCLTRAKNRTSKTCQYGNPHSDTTVVVFGDSHALQYFPAMLKLAERHDWRLVGLTRASCPIGAVDYQPTCNAWRENTLRRIERTERPDLVVTSSGTADRFRVKVGGERLSRSRSERYLEHGYARTFRRLARTGARLAVIRDQAQAPARINDCVAEHSTELARCAFRPDRPALRQFDVRGARLAKRNVKVIDPLPLLCPRVDGARRCPAVIGNALVYRNSYHLSATFARTLADWLDRRLPRPAR